MWHTLTLPLDETSSKRKSKCHTKYIRSIIYVYISLITTEYNHKHDREREGGLTHETH